MSTTRIVVALAAAVALVAALAAGATARGAAPPQFTGNPSIEGNPVVGRTLAAVNGTWSNNPTSFKYQWDRCDLAGDRQNCQPISGATHRRYTLQRADVDHQVRVRVTACNADGCNTKDSKSVIVVDNTGPKLTAAPTIAGTAKVGETLTANHGTWGGNPTSYAYEWLQCDAKGNGCIDSGTRGTTYGVRTADIGHTIRVRVTARNAAGSSSATSDQTDVVTAAGGGSGGGGGGGAATPVSQISLPDRLVVSGISFSPTRITHSAFTARFKVTETQGGKPISGALVYVLGLPYGWVRNAPETPTDANGVATITIVPTSAMPSRGALVMFVRARKPGENLLAGISTRRLVQVLIRG